MWRVNLLSTHAPKDGHKKEEIMFKYNTGSEI